ncbi:MAG: hypothetical protein QM650_05435 [Microlunatus sp.]
MTSKPSPTLDSFETALLTQLKEEVSARNHASQTEPDSPCEPRRRWGQRRWYATAALVAASITAVALGTHVLKPTPAYAVTGRNGEEVTVKVMRLEGADQLQQALRDRGIPADITYLPMGKKCAAGRYQATSTPGLLLGVGQDWFEVTIPKNAVGNGDTFVLTAAVAPIENGLRASVEFDVAHGTVSPCRVVDDPQASPPTPTGGQGQQRGGGQDSGGQPAPTATSR